MWMVNRMGGSVDQWMGGWMNHFVIDLDERCVDASCSRLVGG